MKFQTTKKRIREGYRDILSVGYCDLQSLLNYESPIAYSAGTNGWACDYYEIDGVLISTGYGPIGQDVDYDLIKEYEKKANELKHSETRYPEIDEKLKGLLIEFIEKAKNN